MPASLDGIEAILERAFRVGYLELRHLAFGLFNIIRHYVENNTIRIEQIQSILMDILDAAFAPRQIMKQVIFKVLETVTVSLYCLLYYIGGDYISTSNNCDSQPNGHPNWK